MLNKTSTGQSRWSAAFRGLPITLAMVVVMACGTAFAANNPVPFIDLPTVPSAAAPGGSGFTLTVNGAGFVNDSVVNWNGSARVTTFVSAAQVTAEILASDVATASTAFITVSNPAPGGGTSNVAYFEVTTPPSSVIVTGLPLPEFVDAIPIAADLNNDGKLDLILYTPSGFSLQGAVALGNGDGTFQPEIAIVGGDIINDNIGGGIPGLGIAGDYALVDFNGDGNLDLAVMNAFGAILVLLGNGDGTFQPPIKVGLGNDLQFAKLAVGDFNQDGKLDFVTDYLKLGSTGIAVLLGNGDGTFQAPVNYPAPFNSSYPLAVGDFNGDGVLDLLGFQNPNLAAVMLGNGDGTFQSPVLSSALGGGFIQNVSAADVNGDGRQDLIFSSTSAGPRSYAAAVQLGDGTGAFSAASGTVSGLPAFPPGDFNGDGKLDLATSAEFAPFPVDDLSIWIGNGDGTFGAAVPITTTTGQPLFPWLEGDFNGDGKMDLIASAGSGTNGILWLFFQGSLPLGNLSPDSLNFGNQTIGTAVQQIVTLTNTGTAILTLSPVTVSGTNASEFSQTNNCPASLAVGAACQITVTFTPTSSGSQGATLNIPHNGLGSQTVPLAGSGDTALPTVALSPAALNFAPEGIGTHSSQNVTLTNTGPGTLRQPTITVTGANAGDFSEVNICSSGLPAGASCQVTVTFSPTTVGSRSATLKISDNASGSPQSVALTGSGPDFSTSSPSPPSLTIAAGQTANYTFEVVPLGGFSQTVTLTCGGAPPQSECELPASITLNGSDNTTVALTVTTAARSLAMKQRDLSSGGRWLACGLLGFPLVSLVGVGIRRRRAYVYRWTFLLLVVAAMSLMPACGGGNSGGVGGSGTPAGTYLLTVAGKYTTGGTTLTHSTTLTLVVE